MLLAEAKSGREAGGTSVITCLGKGENTAEQLWERGVRKM